MQLIYNPMTQQFELIHNGTRKTVPQSKLIQLGGDVEALVNAAKAQPREPIEVPNTTNARGVTRRIYHSALY